MSHSQFHSKNLFILRHAWLNLWDKHMTTGRINQVTIRLESDSQASLHPLWKAKLIKPISALASLSRRQPLIVMTSVVRGAVFLAEIGSTHRTRSSLSPDLTSFEYDLQVRAPSKRRDLSHDPKRRLPTLGRTVKATTTRRIFEWLIAIWVAQRVLIHIINHRGQTIQKIDVRLLWGTNINVSLPSIN
jgi:hypothetical protein